MTRDPKIVRLVVFGRGGDSVYYAPDGQSTCTGSGYGSPDNPHAADFSADHKLADIVPDGTPVIDLTVDGCDIMYAVRGPMVDVRLADGEVDRLTDGRSVVTAGMDAGFGGLLTYHDMQRAVAPKKLGSLDSVSVPYHVQAWREHGARIGQYMDREIVWEA
jgi:hypothetical protein